MKNLKAKSLELLQNGKLEEAVGYFLSNADNNTLIYNDVLIISFRLAQTNNYSNQELITGEVYRVSINRIKQSFLYCLKKGEKEEKLDQEELLKSRPKTDFSKIAPEQLRPELYNFIANNKLDDAISLFNTQVDPTDKIKLELVLLNARYNNIKHEKIKGTISFESEQKEMNGVGKRLLKLLDLFEKQKI